MTGDERNDCGGVINGTGDPAPVLYRCCCCCMIDILLLCCCDCCVWLDVLVVTIDVDDEDVQQVCCDCGDGCCSLTTGSLFLV